ncbi:MAG: electron transport complex subunit E [bacterium]|nr:electron transport complex subunit E [bacterium]
MLADFRNGLLTENPVLRLVLGLCPALAVSTALMNGFWMGVAVTFVLTASNLLISLIRGFIPSRVRIPCFIVVIATFVTVVDLSMNAFLPEMHKILGIFVPLIVVNCIILARAEAFASRRPALNAVADGLGMGLGFTVALMLVSAVREFLGTANLVVGSTPLFGDGLPFAPAKVMTLPPGAFITLGLAVALLNVLTRKPPAARAHGAREEVSA